MSATQRDPGNVSSYADHEVLVSLNPDAQLGRDGSISADWFALGIEADDSKLELTRNIDEETISGNGFGVIDTRHKPGKVEGKVTILEDNDIIRQIMFPDSVTTADGVTIARHTGRVLKLVYASIFTDDDGKRIITVSRRPAEAMCPSIGRGDKAEGREVSFTFFPDDTKAIFEFYTVEAGTDVTPINLDSVRFTDHVDVDSPKSFAFSVKGATGGTYDVTAGPFTATGIAFGADAAAIKKALRAAGDENVEVAGDVSGGFTITKANGPVKVDAAKLTGGGFPKRVKVTS